MIAPLRVEFQFDFGSPNAYLAQRIIPAIEARTGVKFDYVPILLGGVFKLTGNRSPAELSRSRFISLSNALTFAPAEKPSPRQSANFARSSSRDSGRCLLPLAKTMGSLARTSPAAVVISTFSDGANAEPSIVSFVVVVETRGMSD